MTTALLFSNVATTTLAAALPATGAGATTAIVAAGTGQLYPSPAAGQGFVLTLFSNPGQLNREVCLCTARSGDTLTLVRAQEGTIAQAWNIGDFAQNLVTAGTLAQVLQSAQPATIKTAQFDGTTLDAADSLTATLVGNGASSLLKANLTAISASATQFGATAQIAMTSRTLGGSLGNAALYVGAEAQPGSGNLWAINPLLTVDAGGGINVRHFQVLEVDFNNNDAADANGSTFANGIDITTAGLKRGWAALGVYGGVQGGGPGWQYGVLSGVNNSCNLAAFAAVGNSTYALDLSGYTGQNAIHLPGGPVITSGAGAPALNLPDSSIYLRTDGSTGSRLYVSAGGGSWTAVSGV